MMGWAVDAVHMDQKRNACKVLVRNPEGNGPIVGSRHRWVDILNWVSEKQDKVVWLRIETSGGLL
jgi:hypothetical protein